jgi:hypothetical protein
VVICWGIRNQAFRIPKIKECFQLPKVLCERLSGETPGVLESTFISQNPSFDRYPLSPAEPPNKLRITQGVRVSVRLCSFPRDETPEMNLTHPFSLGLGFAWGVSSSLTSNDFKFECDPCYRWRKVPAKGEPPKDWRSSPDRRTWWQLERRRNLRRDVMKRRLCGDLIGDLSKIA